MTDPTGQSFFPGCAPRGYADQEWSPERKCSPSVQIPNTREHAKPPSVQDLDRAERARVRGRVQVVVLAWCRERLAAGAPEFRMAELAEHVATTQTTAPDSAGRILRELRQVGLVDYTLLSRSRSEYRLDSARTAGEPTP